MYENDCTPEPALVSSGAPATPQAFVDLVADDLRRAVAAIIRAGEHLIAAKEALRHGEWQRMFRGAVDAVERPLPFGERTAQMLMRIARHPVLANPKHVSVLPASWGTLHELTRVPEPVLCQAITDGRITPGMERRDVEALRGAPAAPTSPGWPLTCPAGCEAQWRELVRLEQAADALRQRAATVRSELLQRSAGPLPKIPAPIGIDGFYSALIAAGAERCDVCHAYHYPGDRCPTDLVADSHHPILPWRPDWRWALHLGTLTPRLLRRRGLRFAWGPAGEPTVEPVSAETPR